MSSSERFTTEEDKNDSIYPSGHRNLLHIYSNPILPGIPGTLIRVFMCDRTPKEPIIFLFEIRNKPSRSCWSSYGVSLIKAQSS